MNASEGAPHPLSAACYADQARQLRVPIIENERIARNTFRVRFECPELAAAILPGQFLMIRLADCNDPLLARPFALYDTVLDATNSPSGVDVVYLEVGKMTHKLSEYQAGEILDVWGPLGNGFSPQPVEHLILVAGGIGQTPFLALAREFLGGRQYGNPARRVTPARKVTLCYGVRSAEFLAGVEEFRACGVNLQIASDDGSVGHHGFVTEVLEQVLADSPGTDRRIACCGPEKMMEAVAHIVQRSALPCEVSLETPMACGIGICFSCVVKVLQPDGQWDYKRTCVEGPVFDATKIVW